MKKKIKKIKKVIPKSHGIVVKKQFGQHFLRNDRVVKSMLNAVTLTPDSSLFEIGCGDGFLTQEIVTHDFARLWIFEIDPEWANHVTNLIRDPRITMHEENILDVDFKKFEQYAPWTLLANLPYQVTFPILRLLKANRHLLKEGVVMVQEEVAQKIVASRGRSYGFISLYFQYYFDWKLLDKIKPGSFFPPPKVNSRLLHFTPKTDSPEIPDSDAFWQFIKICFKQPRRMLRNNLMNSNYDIARLDDQTLSLRAQQMDLQQLLDVWKRVKD